MIAFLKDSLRTPYQRLMEMLLSEQRYFEGRYLRHMGHRLNLADPSALSEKLQYLKLYHRPALLPALVDKFEVRKYVEGRGCAWTLNELLGVYERVEDLDLSVLPDAFVLKMTHSSGWNILCRDKASLNWDRELKKVRRWLKSNYYSLGREWVYKSIRPRFVVEPFLEVPGGEELLDYKFYCFEGAPLMLNVDMERFSGHKRNLYDLDWNLLPFGYEFPTSSRVIPRPANLEEMIQVATTLSQGLFFCRVDLFSVAGRTIFGELTFYPSNGFSRFDPPEYDQIWGAKMNLANLGKYT